MAWINKTSINRKIGVWSRRGQGSWMLTQSVDRDASLIELIPHAEELSGDVLGKNLKHY